MAKNFTAKINQLLNSHSEKITDEVRKRLKELAQGSYVRAEDLQMFALAGDYSMKGIMESFYTSYVYLGEEQILDLIEKENTAELIFIASVCILIMNDEYYLVNINQLNSENRIRHEVISKLTEYFLRKGYPVQARLLSTKAVFYHPVDLEHLICTETDFYIYMFGPTSFKSPYINKLSAVIFNSLSKESDREFILAKLCKSYETFEVDKVFDGFFTVKLEGDRHKSYVSWADFDQFETDSRLKQKLIMLQSRLFSQA